MLLRLLAKLLATRPVIALLLRFSWPYHNIVKDGSLYMERRWLFNPYPLESSGESHSRWPSIRLHRIMRPDDDDHLHDHPWPARTFILRGWYAELDANGERHLRYAGETRAISATEFHQIVNVSAGGCLTLFVTWPYVHRWGYKVGDRKVSYRDYWNGER